MHPRGGHDATTPRRKCGSVWAPCLGTRLAQERAVDDVLAEAHYVPLLLEVLGELAEELADHGGVVRVARALLPTRYFTPI